MTFFPKTGFSLTEETGSALLSDRDFPIPRCEAFVDAFGTLTFERRFFALL